MDCFSDNVRQIIDIDDIYETADEFVNRGLKYYTESDNYKVPRWYKKPHYVWYWLHDIIASKGLPIEQPV